MKVAFTTMILSVALLAAPSARGASCAANIVTDHTKWMNSSASGKRHVVRVTAVSNQANRIASYAEGELKVTAVPFPGTNATGAISGILKQYFSDRTYTGNAAKGGIAVDRHPFSASQTDSLELTLLSDGDLYLRLKSWGNTIVKLGSVGCTAGVITAVTETSPRSVYVISLAKDTRSAVVLR